ncbi:peptidoglycan-binding domain-containing protein [Alteromonas sp. 1_MG-2023]|uniref:peptidoglycan-binding domain-containing protein n=1 Tax=Alteromonas sp. 1_MG-2023 TaxID=3062669 RepID=UPI0026E1DF65|nr:peptidoglycan-binding domain-containing protein [Alteromonas sp. 1_MG-2023]MDO6566437.1 peptidoglycan-binding domain-containing protein [Alteromonas sp. 1_MG-2023]
MKKLGVGLDTSVSKQYLPNATAASDNPNETDSSAYIRAIRARLIELGYLGEGHKFKNRHNPQIDHILIKKIKHFQQDAGITQDGWAGNLTWKVLECLVSFENQQSPALWGSVWKNELKLPSQDSQFVAGPLKDGIANNKAVMRAVYCRLYTLGFFSDWDKHRINTQTIIKPSDNADFQHAIDRFCVFAKQLNLVNSSCSGLDMSLLNAMFEYDSIVARLSNNTYFEPVYNAFPANIEAITRVELWLLGYDISPGKDQTIRKPVKRFKKKTFIKISKTYLALKQFYSDYPVVRNNPKDYTLNTHLMAAFSRLSSDVEAKDEDNGRDNDRLNESVSQLWKSKSKQSVLREQFNKLANGIFDGLKRVVSWLFGVVKRVLESTKEAISNIARYISKRARESYLGVVKAFDIVYSGMSYLKGSAYHYGDAAKSCFAHDNDFDQHCCIDPKAQPYQISFDSTQYSFQGKLYAAGLNILGHLFSTAQRVVRMISSPVGWLFALLSLANVANSIKEISKQIELVKRYELDIAHQQSLFKTRIS